MTPKQEIIYNRAIELFDSELINEEKKKRIHYSIKTTYDIDYLEYTDEMIKDLVNDVVYDEDLFKKFIIPPFSVLDTKQGVWKDRKAVLDNYLGDSTVGRDENLTFSKSLKYGEKDTGTSRFDSVLTELCLKWFGIEGGLVLDPFAGGHIRGTVASLVGMRYLGIDLNKEQIDANIKRNEELELPNINWINDDALNADKYIKDGTADLIFTCPPYGDLEKYTDDPRDISNMAYEQFMEVYNKIISIAVRKLKENRFAVFVVGDFRDKEGFYRGFVKNTIECFRRSNVKLYNELILLNSIITAAMRASNSFRNRKMVKSHQNVLVFYKGDPNQIQNLYKKINTKIPVNQPEQQSLI